MIGATGYILRCESEAACTEMLAGRTRFLLVEEARAAGWQIGVKLNGEHARRNGKDYCPAHRRTRAATGNQPGFEAADIAYDRMNPDPYRNWEG